MGNLSHYPVCFFPYCSGSPAFLSLFPSQPLAMGVSLEWILFQASAQQSGNMFWTLTSGRYSVYLYTCTLENKMYLMNVALLQTLLSPRKAEAKCRALEFLKEQPGLCALCPADRPRLGQRQARGATLRRLSEVPVGQSRLQNVPGGGEGRHPLATCAVTITGAAGRRCRTQSFPPHEASTTGAGKMGLSFGYLRIRCSSAGVPRHRPQSPGSPQVGAPPTVSRMTRARGLGNCSSRLGLRRWGGGWCGLQVPAGGAARPGALGAGPPGPLNHSGSLRGPQPGTAPRGGRAGRGGGTLRGGAFGALSFPRPPEITCEGAGAGDCGPWAAGAQAGGQGTRVGLPREPAPSPRRRRSGSCLRPAASPPSPGPPRRLFMA